MKAPEENNFITHTLGITGDIVLGLLAGICIDNVCTYLHNTLGWPFLATIILQLALIIIALYLEKKYGYWGGDNNYGILFTSFLLAPQHNLFLLFNYIFKRQSEIVPLVKI
jgi:ABC-type sugar transport system permease subunit